MRLQKLLALALLSTLPCFAQGVCPDRQSPAAIDARIDKLIAQMSIEERIAQLGDRAPAIPRLGLHGYNWWNEGLHGLARDGYATVFPQAIGLAATWDTALLHEVGATVSTEARAHFNAHAGADSPRYAGLTIWSPNINIFRDPRWGRGQETYGEDPYLTASLGVQFVRGLQGDDPFYLRTDATPKHFAAHSGPEEGRDSFNAKASAHDLADTYLPAFHALTTQAHAAALMCSYNALNGTPMCANESVLEQRVRKGWGWNGYVVSDCDAVGNITGYQHYTADAAHGAAAALKAGVDLDCGSSYGALREAYAQKLVSEEDINRSLHRLLLARLKLGMLDPECDPYRNIGETANDTAASRALALRAAEESVVLLKNDGVLPLRPERRIAVVGPTADMVRVVEANYHGSASHPVTPLAGLRERFADVRYAQGSVLTAGVAAPVPASALRVSREANAPHGLTAEYFTATSFDGHAAMTERVETVDLDLDHVSPSLRFKLPHAVAGGAARWSGWFVPPAAGDYLLRVNSKRCGDCGARGRFRLLLDGKVVLENDGSKGQLDSYRLHAADTTPHALRLELVEANQNEIFALEWEPPAEALLAEAVEAARQAEVIVAFVGLSPDLEGEALPLHLDGFAGGDRTSLDLPAAQLTLLARLRELHKPLVVVLNSGSAVALDADRVGASALLASWYPGEEGGHALANLLTGRANPSGRLPLTFYRTAADLPAFDDYSMAGRTYRYFTKPVLYPFGFGLSYANFVYSSVKLSRAGVQAGASLTATVTLTNRGKVAGSEVAELYLAPPQHDGAPRLALAGTQRVMLAPGASKQLTFTLDAAQMSFVNAEGRRAIRAGEYTLYVGGAQPQTGQDKGVSFHIVGEKAIDF